MVPPTPCSPGVCGSPSCDGHYILIGPLLNIYVNTFVLIVLWIPLTYCLLFSVDMLKCSYRPGPPSTTILPLNPNVI